MAENRGSNTADADAEFLVVEGNLTRPDRREVTLER
jgi:hypothetical protein